MSEAMFGSTKRRHRGIPLWIRMLVSHTSSDTLEGEERDGGR